MFDEPFAGVDPKSIYELKEIFSDMAKKQSIAVVISDHNVDQLLSIANNIYVVIDGKIGRTKRKSTWCFKMEALYSRKVVTENTVLLP